MKKHEPALIISILSLIVSTFGALFSAYIGYKQAQIAENNLIQTKEQAKIQTRAYVSVPAAEITNLAAGEQPRFVLQITNNGSTPARNIRINEQSNFVEKNSAPIYQFSGIDRLVAGQISQGGSNFKHYGYGRSLTQAEFDNYKAGQALRIIYKITFEDIFGTKYETFGCLQKDDTPVLTEKELTTCG